MISANIHFSSTRGTLWRSDPASEPPAVPFSPPTPPTRTQRRAALFPPTARRSIRIPRKPFPRRARSSPPAPFVPPFPRPLPPPARIVIPPSPPPHLAALPPPPAPPPPRCPSPDARDLSRTPTDRQAQTAGGLAVWLPGNAALPASMPASMREGASSQPAAISGSAIAQIPRRIPGRRREIVSRVSGAGVGLTFGGATRALHLPAALPSPVH